MQSPAGKRGQLDHFKDAIRKVAASAYEVNVNEMRNKLVKRKSDT